MSLTELFNFSTILLLILLLICTALFKYIVVPKWLMQFYIKQGLTDDYFFPVLGAIWRGIKDAQKGCTFISSRKICKANPQSKCIVSNFSDRAMLYLCHPSTIEAFLSKQTQFYIKDMKYIRLFKSGIPNGLTFIEGHQWKDQRRAISSAFHYEFLSDNIPLIQEIVSNSLDKFLCEKEYHKLKLVNVIQNITGEVMGRLFFGKNIQGLKFEDGSDFCNATCNVIRDVNKANFHPITILFGKKVMELLVPGSKKTMENVLAIKGKFKEFVAERKKGFKLENRSKHDDLLGLLLKGKDSDDLNMDDSIVDNYLNFFAGGTESTSTLTTMILYNLSKHPEYINDIEVEIEKYCNREVSMENLKSMEFLDAFIRETFRFYSTSKSTFFREAVEDHVLDGIKIKKGTLVTPLFDAHDFSSLVYENPEIFNPKRWLKNKLSSSSLIHFAPGSRSCIGQHLAMAELKILVSEILKKFNFQVCPEYVLKMEVNLFYEPSQPVIFDFEHKGSEDIQSSMSTDDE